MTPRSHIEPLSDEAHGLLSETWSGLRAGGDHMTVYGP